MSRFPKISIFGAAVLIAAISVSSLRAAETANKSLRIHGATSVASIIQPWVAEFEKEGKISVLVYGSTDGKGLEALNEKRADIAMLAHRLNTAEKEKALQQGIVLEDVHICNDGIPIIVNPANPVSELTLDQVKSIFTGKYTNWKEVGGPDQAISLVIMPPDTGYSKFLKSTLLKDEFSIRAEQVTTNMAAKVVQGRPWAISYTRQETAESGQSSGELKMIRLKKEPSGPAVPLNMETVEKKTYPLLRPLFLAYDKKTAGPLVKDFLSYCTQKGVARNDASGVTKVSAESAAR